MEQITLVFLVGAFVLFLLQLKFKKEQPLKMMGFFSAGCVIALSLIDGDLTTSGEDLAVMLLTGFAFLLYSIIGMLREV